MSRVTVGKLALETPAGLPARPGLAAGSESTAGKSQNTQASLSHE